MWLRFASRVPSLPIAAPLKENPRSLAGQPRPRERDGPQHASTPSCANFEK